MTKHPSYLRVLATFARNSLVYLSYSEAAEQQSPQIGETDDFRLSPLDMSDTNASRDKLKPNALLMQKTSATKVPLEALKGQIGSGEETYRNPKTGEHFLSQHK